MKNILLSQAEIRLDIIQALSLCQKRNLYGRSSTTLL